MHGFAGWGRNELLGYKYWGGFVDLECELNNRGYTAYTATVGPFSSNWDRACELYAYIKGGTVDYGEEHSIRHGHARYGRTYPGVYPEWGEINENGDINKIHLVGHSMGGQTVRMLVQLLEEGHSQEMSTTFEGINPLFEGGKSWVCSVTTISSPHDGTTLADGANMLKNFGRDMITFVASVSGAGSEPLYEFKLEHWGLKRNSGERFSNYVNRVFNSSVWNEDNRDFSVWDLSTLGASEINSWVKAQPNVYYFSWTTIATKKGLITDRHYPDLLKMNPFFVPTGTFIGQFIRNEGNKPIIGSKWFGNDGVVNAISQTGPKLNSTDIVLEYNGTAQIGKWNHMGVLNGYDHGAIIGTFASVRGWYIDLARELRRLN